MALQRQRWPSKALRILLIVPMARLFAPALAFVTCIALLHGCQPQHMIACPDCGRKLSSPRCVRKHRKSKCAIWWHTVRALTGPEKKEHRREQQEASRLRAHLAQLLTQEPAQQLQAQVTLVAPPVPEARVSRVHYELRNRAKRVRHYTSPGNTVMRKHYDLKISLQRALSVVVRA